MSGRASRIITAVSLALLACALLLAARAPSLAETIRAEPHTDQAGNTIVELKYAGGVVDFRFRAQDYDVPASSLVGWVTRSAQAVSTYFGRFPVPRVRLTLSAIPGDIVATGSAIADRGARIHIRLGRSISAAALAADSILVHEMAHLAVPDHHEKHLWFHEGMATYVEVIGRVQAGQITPARAWAEFMAELPNGTPRRGDRGLDGTPSWNRRYWGGALFFLAADVEIRKQTANRLGLQDALRGVQAAGGSLERSWPLDKLIATADRATGTQVLRRLYAEMGERPGAIDLERLWTSLGIRRDGRRLTFDDAAPLTTIRWAITDRPSQPLLVAAPRLMRETSRAR